MQFLRVKMGKTNPGTIRNTHIMEELRMEDIQNQQMEIDRDGSDISKEWIGTEYQKDYWK
jgi:hypothetical protein